MQAADLVAAEDTRITGKLLTLKGIKKPFVRIDEHTDGDRILELVRQAASGKIIAFATDAGTPGVSDPGVDLVEAAYEFGVQIDAIPGPSAVTNALALSGFYAQKYTFLGFLSKKPGSLRSELESYLTSSMTLVFFESPHRIGKTLKAVAETLGDRRIAVCREMTKLHQDVRRGRISEVVETNLPAKGEYTVVIEGFRRGVASAG